MKEISFYLFLGDKLNTRTLLVGLECFKDRAFHIETVYVNSLDPSRGCTLQAELIVTTSLEPSESDSGIVPLQWESVVGLPHCFIMPVARSVVQCLQRFVQPA